MSDVFPSVPSRETSLSIFYCFRFVSRAVLITDGSILPGNSDQQVHLTAVLQSHTLCFWNLIFWHRPQRVWPKGGFKIYFETWKDAGKQLSEENHLLSIFWFNTNTHIHSNTLLCDQVWVKYWNKLGQGIMMHYRFSPLCGCTCIGLQRSALTLTWHFSVCF